MDILKYVAMKVKSLRHVHIINEFDGSSGLGGVRRIEPSMISEQVRRLRAAAGWSQADLARRAKLGIATVSRIEREAGNPTRDSLEAIATALGCSVEELLGQGHDCDKRPLNQAVQVGFLLVAFERMTVQLNEMILAHGDMRDCLETLLLAQGWPEGKKLGQLVIPENYAGSIAKDYIVKEAT